MFKAGDKVRCIRNLGAELDLTVGNTYVVKREPVGNMLYLFADDRHVGAFGGEGWYVNRFELVAPEAVIPAPAIIGPFKAGDEVVCVTTLGAVRGQLEVGQKYIVEEYEDGLNPKLYVRIKGTAWSVDRFKLAAPAAPVAPEPVRPFAVGDKVFVVKKPKQEDLGRYDWIEDSMDKFVNDVNSYEVTHPLDTYGRVRLSCGWWFPVECLQHADAAPAAKAVAPIVEPAKPDAVETIRNELVKRELEEGGHNSITSFAIKRVGGDVEYFIDPACFAPVNRNQKPVEIFVLEVCKHKKADQASCTPYLNYLFNDSPWAPCFITKDVKEAYEKGVVMNCNLPLGQLVGAGCAVREAIEHEDQLPIFNKLLKAGYHGNVAYLMCLTVQGDDKYSLMAARGGHCAMTTSACHEDVLSFFKNGFPDIGAKAANAPGATHYSIFNQISQKARPKLLYYNYAENKLPGTVVGTGWNKNTVVLERSIYEFASFLSPLITPEQK